MGHAGLEGWVALVDGDAGHPVAQAVGVRMVCFGDHQSEIVVVVVVAGMPWVVGHMVLLRNGLGLGPEGAPQVVVQQY